MKLSELIAQLGIAPAVTSLSSPNPHDPDLVGVAAIDQATPGMLSFVEGAPGVAHIDHTQASTLILPWDQDLQARALARGITWIASDQPRYLFARAIACFYQPWQLPPTQHPSVVIDPSVVVGTGVGIGAHVVIQGGVSLGNKVQIHPNVVIYPQVTIGDRTILHANCVIHERTVIGADCVIHSGAVIGAEGFGFVPVADHGWYGMPQSGRTVLEDQVVVGCNTTIDRPAVGETRIGKGTKIDNLVQIGHGCQLGEDSLLCAQVGLAGATRIGKRVILAGQVGVSGQVELGDRTVVAAQSGVHQSLPADAQVAGYPAINHRRWLRAMALVKQLPQLWQRVKALEQQVGK
ncbi:MAG: UDP-3-O-(3-hydroxymyristoyl)glucosamine N-acyltransferase [Acaryochloris sp. RU_4_1]|nr:UDP-3-O-(3-hydroxymyristoyl)glucosamine N-acyltransferase [Acaryochloris sp. SU_5_25]NJM67170.1 UDP-3-O-(3-hydroxymyristoyl)glucosamine N-acyltransferase [Acaryochloris sp. RU_4_1]NJN38146.1 UDP-3-O-(3-hydroxymyristoyl)glucosamine N-acyltransferase [Acaryochloridaceae cyanobacterium CSU_3_4]NJR56265.1 UDP-3-O-(3-hydroxymyristoyl)glucosamine N-acyltransferase [Acaryochloris sp. CRU_2_0]